MTEVVLALDIGGTKIAAGLVDEVGTVLRSALRPTPLDDARQTFSAVRAALDEVLSGQDVCGVGIACAGPVDTVAGTVSPINVPAWQAFPLRDLVAEVVPGVPVRLAGDGVCMALAEHRRGAGQGSSGFLLGMVVSTGIGGGLVLDGRPYGGRTGNAGHIGHIVLEPDGLPCTCGGRGCVETVAAGPMMVRWAREQGWQPPQQDLLAGSSPHPADAATLAEAARAGDPLACAAFERSGYAVGMAVASVAAVCDLDLVVIGGGVAKAGPLLFDPIRRALRVHAGLSYLEGLRVVPASLGAQAGLVGAAALVVTNR